MPEGTQTMTFLAKVRASLIATLGAIGIYVAAMWSPQPDVKPVYPPPVLVESNAVRMVAVDYHTSVTVSGVTYRVTIKRGLLTDGASIPRLLRGKLGISPYDPCIVRAGVVHDVLYLTHAVDKATADAILRKIALDDNTLPEKAQAIWQAVHDCGWWAWDHPPRYVDLVIVETS